jgi:hypothetical protein
VETASNGGGGTMTRPAVGLRQRHYDRITWIMHETGVTRTEVVEAALDAFLNDAILEKILREVVYAKTHG